MAKSREAARASFRRDFFLSSFRLENLWSEAKCPFASSQKLPRPFLVPQKPESNKNLYMRLGGQSSAVSSEKLMSSGMSLKSLPSGPAYPVTCARGDVGAEGSGFRIPGLRKVLIQRSRP